MFCLVIYCYLMRGGYLLVVWLICDGVVLICCLLAVGFVVLVLFGLFIYGCLVGIICYLVLVY